MRYGRWGVSFDASETAETGRIARSLGGYEEMLRLERDLAGYQRKGVAVRMVLDAEGRRQLEPVGPAEPARKAEPQSSPVPARRLRSLLKAFLR